MEELLKLFAKGNKVWTNLIHSQTGKTFTNKLRNLQIKEKYFCSKALSVPP